MQRNCMELNSKRRSHDFNNCELNGTVRQCSPVLPVALHRLLHATPSDHPHLLLWSPNKIHLRTPDMLGPPTYTQGSASYGIQAGCYGVKRLIQWRLLVRNVTWVYAAYDHPRGSGANDR